MIRTILCIFLSLNILLAHSQTEGIGYSSVYKLNENVNAMNEALFNAQENAAINSGSNISSVSVEKSTDKIQTSGAGATDASFQSKRIDLRTEMIKAVVKTIGKPSYDTIRVTKNKYQVKVTGMFLVDHENTGNLLPLLDELGQTIKIEVSENDCFGRFYDYAKEYFRQKQNSIFLSRQKFPLGETDFGIEVFSDRITLIDRKAAPNYAVKVFKVRSCNDAITLDYSKNEIFDEIRKEIFFYYMMRDL